MSPTPDPEEVPDDELFADVLALGALSNLARGDGPPADAASDAAGEIVDKYKPKG